MLDRLRERARLAYNPLWVTRVERLRLDVPLDVAVAWLVRAMKPLPRGLFGRRKLYALYGVVGPDKISLRYGSDVWSGDHPVFATFDGRFIEEDGVIYLQGSMFSPSAGGQSGLNALVLSMLGMTLLFVTTSSPAMIAFLLAIMVGFPLSGISIRRAREKDLSHMANTIRRALNRP